MAAVRIPMGISAEVRLRAILSIKTTKAPPISIDIGIEYLWSGPTIILAA